MYHHVTTQCGVHIGDRGQHLPFNLYVFQGILGLTAGLRHNRRHRFALPTHSVNGHRVLSRRLDAFEMPEHTNPWRAKSGNVLAIKRCDHARLASRRLQIQRHHLGVRVRTAYKHHMRQAG